MIFSGLEIKTKGKCNGKTEGKRKSIRVNFTPIEYCNDFVFFYITIIQVEKSFLQNESGIYG